VASDSRRNWGLVARYQPLPFTNMAQPCGRVLCLPAPYLLGSALFAPPFPKDKVPSGRSGESQRRHRLLQASGRRVGPTVHSP
jgi:hypothetical protein